MARDLEDCPPETKYAPVEPLVYDYNITIVPISPHPQSDDFSIGHHELQVKQNFLFNTMTEVIDCLKDSYQCKKKIIVIINIGTKHFHDDY